MVGNRIRMHKFINALGPAALLLLCPSFASAEWGLNMTQGVTPLSRDVYDLHMLILWICVAIGIVVFGAMFVSILMHRKSKGHEAHQFHHSTIAEILWTIIPVFILIGMAVPATRVLVDMENVGDADMTIKVTGYQWKWHYEYIGDDLGFFSLLGEKSNAARQLNSGIDPRSVENYLLEVDEPLVLPINKRIRFLTTADDVLHAWWVPDLGWKRDSIPGFINESWALIEKPGTYRGQCAELCGKDHAFMPIVIEAVDQTTYEKWKSAKKAEIAERAAIKTMTKGELLASGKRVFARMCVACHQANGEGLPPTYPSMVGSAIVTGPLQDHLDIVLNGSSKNPLMQAFGKQLSASELAAVITYERNSWGNDALVPAGTDVVQPAAIKAELDK
jgi:cytochrome c oxidase subunit 2